MSRVKEVLGNAATADRFAERAREARRTRIRRALIGTGVLVLVGVLAWLVAFSSVFAVRTVEVDGLPAGAARSAIAAMADSAKGTPLARVDVGSLAGSVRTQPVVAEVTVHRRFPSTLLIQVVPRTPALAIQNPKGQLEVVDKSGVRFGTVATKPAGVPLVVASSSQGLTEDSLRTALTVLADLPPDLTARVQAMTVSSADLVTFRLGGTEVVWGGAADGPLKVKVVTSLLATRPAKIDVSAPNTPVTQ